jgi:hypothetical protein
VNWIGEIPLWYDGKSRQLKLRAHDGPARYLPADAYEPGEVVDLFK